MSIENVLRTSYSKVRGRELPADVPTAVLAGVASRSAVNLARGLITGQRYGQRSALHFRDRRVRVTYPTQLRIGRGVVFASDVTVEAFSRDGIVLGDRVTVARGASLLASGVIREPGIGITIGSDTSIGLANVLWGQGGLTIGRDCLFGPHVVLVSEQHVFDDSSTPVRLQGHKRDSISIGDDVWLGAGVKVMPGVSIGQGAVVGANSVVTTSIPDHSVAVGIPAKVIRSRGESR